ncbi:MAG TPA: hypothetical protein VK781_04855 [Solirubrobacteraceae bacterium]|jgi:hypothetical protein|nr:hypothetical protein [Solirubrobacteraceae bacterium]
MSNEETSTNDTSPQDPAVHGQPAATHPSDPLTYEPAEETGEWVEEPDALELPPRPRRRLLTPVPLALGGVLLIACGFVGGVLVEKGQSAPGVSSTAGAASLASRFAALRGGASAAAGGPASTSARAAFGGSQGSAAGFSRPTAGTVAYLAGSTLYVTNSEGNTVKVTSSPATSVTKTVGSSVKAIHPGETVTVVGPSGAGGAVIAESISVGSSAGGFAGLFGGGGARDGFGAGARDGARGSGGTGRSGGEPALFGG